MTDGAGNDEAAAWRHLVERYGTPAGADGAPVPWPAREELPGGDADGDGDVGGQAEPPLPGADPVPGVVPAPPQLRIVRPAVPVPEPAGDQEEDDGHYVPPVPPPLPRLDPVTKGAWAALFGGPGYLLAAVMVGWPIPGWAAFCAVGAFIGGFATLVMRLSDRSPADSGPDDGAVV